MKNKFTKKFYVAQNGKFLNENNYFLFVLLVFFFEDPDPQSYGGYPPYPGQQPPYPGQQPGYPPYQQGPNIGFVNPGAGYPPAQPPYNSGYPGGYPPPPSDYPPQPGSGPSTAYMDPEDPGYAKGFGFDDKTIRQGFIKKVYSILSVSSRFLLHDIVTHNLGKFFYFF